MLKNINPAKRRDFFVVTTIVSNFVLDEKE